ncbi:head maturation protease, ClpP-related [Thalassospira sp.]|uniref:head maturation protease, ClpP-related n=1 Tax=Thalassospira sp. TaxID=1912094 RepID=UPI001B0D842D|nr:head maturation protease, ClpP-related [Thalassospira sp.]MBO6522121.1 ATP-dependent Clp protease proteolytic subunit [Rhodospirillales bacterium]MBO6773765.1 ATP-dependent Clp protease proteolytic subunit [Thalassospira sp.]
MNSWFTARAQAGVAELSIYDEIGAYGVPAKAFIGELKALGDVTNLTLRLNSPGGSVFDGIAIYNALKRHPAKVTITVEGLAASIASVILCAGDEVIMPKNAMIMIHDPSAMVMGNAADMRSMADALDKMRDGLVSAYQDKTGHTPEEIIDWMAEETWFDATEALEIGFADQLEESVPMAATFDLSSYARVPPVLVALATSQSPHSETEETPMSEPNKPDLAETKVMPEPNAETAAETPNDDNVVDIDHVRAQERKATLAYVNEVNQLCALAGTPDLASGFIAKATSTDQIRAALLEARAEADEASAVRAMRPGQANAPSEPVIDTAAIYAARNNTCT